MSKQVLALLVGVLMPIMANAQFGPNPIKSSSGGTGGGGSGNGFPLQNDGNANVKSITNLTSATGNNGAGIFFSGSGLTYSNSGGIVTISGGGVIASNITIGVALPTGLLVIDTNGNFTHYGSNQLLVIQDNSSNTFFQVSGSNATLRIKGIQYTWPATQTGGNLFDDGNGNLSWVAGTNVSIPNTIVPTNFVLNQRYTNSSGSIQLLDATIALITAGVSGNASIDLMVDQTGGSSFSIQDRSAISTLVTSIAQSYTNNLTGAISNNATYYFTNSSNGSGDSATIVPGTGEIITLSDGTAANVASALTTIAINGTASQITSSAGAQTLAGNRTWTLSTPTGPQWTNVMNNGDQYGTNGNTTSTSLDFVASNNLGKVTMQAGLQNNTASALGVVPKPGLVLTNLTLAAAGAQQYSPTLRFAGNGWKTTATAASQPTYFDLLCIPVQGAANPTSVFTISNTINGGTPTFCFQLDQGGNAQFGGGVLMTSFTNSGFSGTAGVLTNGADNVPRVAGVIPASMVGGAPVVYSGNTGPTVVTVNQTTFFSPDQSYGTNQFQTSDATGITRILMPFPGQVMGAYVITSANPGAVANTFTVMTNGVATGIVITMNNVTTGNDTAHPTIPFLAGTEVGVKLITASSGTAVRWEWGIICRATSGF